MQEFFTYQIKLQALCSCDKIVAKLPTGMLNANNIHPITTASSRKTVREMISFILAIPGTKCHAVLAL